jgi:adenosylmethionine-8-amino-7-oxononanoate aminotransferase
VEQTFVEAKERKQPVSAVVVEPLIQGAAGMIAQPEGWLRQVATIAREHQAQVIADEVMTGFGRTGPLFACQGEGVRPDYLAVAKGLTGGYLPMAATLTTNDVFDAFLGEYSEFKTFFHGHSYTGNQLGAAAALASLDLLVDPGAARARRILSQELDRELEALWQLPHVGDIRRVGLIAGVELVRNWHTREAYPLVEKVGIRVCERMASRGVLTRPIGNVLVVMPPYCTSAAQMQRIIRVMGESIIDVCGERP